MRKINRFNLLSRNIIFIAGVTLTTSCVTSPSVKSPTAPPSLPSPTSSTPSPQTSDKTGNQSQTQAKPPNSGTASKTSAKSSDSSDGMDKTKTETGTQQGNNGKTEDQILSEALDEFSNKMKNEQQQASNEQTYETQSPSIESNHTDQGSLTEAEKANILNRQLDDKFAKFDNLMLGERETITKQNNEDGGYDGTFGSVDDGGAEDGPLQTAMIDANPPAGIKSTSGNTNQSINEPPPDLADASGDDIIARQLREAAMKEKDPRLRDKLWNEYRKYKKGAS